MPDTVKFDADVLLEQALLKHKIRLDILVAETAIWANPNVHKRLVEQSNAARYPQVRRARTSKGEIRNKKVNGIKFDDNTAANRAIKGAIGTHRLEIRGYEACHIWPGTCYNERYHTVIANLVLLPRALAGLTDHLPHVQKMLQYRAYELYGWHPAENDVPIRPEIYVSCWRNPEPDALMKKVPAGTRGTRQSTKPALQDRIEKWMSLPNSNVHKIIDLMMLHEGMAKDKFVDLIISYGFSKNPSGAVASLMTDKGNAYGSVLMVDNRNCLFIQPEAKKIMRNLNWV